MAEESYENFSNFDSAFGLEKSERENQNKPKSKPTNENNSAEEDGSSKRRDDLCGRKQRSIFDSSTGTQNTSDKNGFRWLRCQ